MKLPPYLCQRDRLLLDLTTVGLPEVPLVGMHKQTQASAGLVEHAHPGAIEICYVTSGERIYHVDGRDYVMKGNQLFITFPGEPHGSGQNPQGKGVLYWLHVVLPPRSRPFLCLTGADARPLVEGLRRLPARHFTGDRRLQTLFEDVFRRLHEPQSPMTKLHIAMNLVVWFSVLLECAHAEHRHRPGCAPDIRRVLEWLDAHVSEQVAVQRLAALVNLSPSRFKAKFKAEVGIAPAEYWLRRKVDRAGDMLHGGRQTVTQVAFALGFSSSQYFATVYKRFTSRCPSRDRPLARGRRP